MITETQDRHLFIGGSECHIIYMNYHTKTFREFWHNKLEGIVEESSPNRDMAVGTILEESVIDLYESLYQVKGERGIQQIKGFARANTDYIIGNKVSDVKVSKNAKKWHDKGKVPLQYKRQLIHYLFVTGLEKASIIAYQADEALKENPFVELSKENLYEIEVPITDADIQEHSRIITYLEWCRDMGIYPK
jgi:predicted phage-related endonuclease